MVILQTIKITLEMRGLQIQQNHKAPQLQITKFKEPILQ